jgi:hypothetical protein
MAASALLLVAAVVRLISAAEVPQADLPIVDLGYAVHRAELNVSRRISSLFSIANIARQLHLPGKRTSEKAKPAVSCQRLNTYTSLRPRATTTALETSATPTLPLATVDGESPLHRQRSTVPLSLPRRRDRFAHSRIRNGLSPGGRRNSASTPRR